MRCIPLMVLTGCFLDGMTIGPKHEYDTGYVPTDTGDTYTVIVDSGTEKRYCEDLDLDGYGNENECVVRTEAPENYVLADNGMDCDDTSPTAYPGADELDEDIDENCDGIADEGEGDDPTLWCHDEDGDGYGAGECLAEYAGFPGYVQNDNDCDDANPDANPDASEWEHDFADNDCDGFIDENYRDAVVCVTPVDAEIYEVFVAGLTFTDFDYAPNHRWEPTEAWLDLVTETNGAEETADEAPELILERAQSCALYRVDWGDEFVLNGLVKTADNELRLLVDAALDRHRMAAIKVDGVGNACLLENMQFRCVRP